MHMSARHLLRLFLFSTTLGSFKRVTFLIPLWDQSKSLLVLPEKCHVLLNSLLRILSRELFCTWINQSDHQLYFSTKLSWHTWVFRVQNLRQVCRHLDIGKQMQVNYMQAWRTTYFSTLLLQSSVLPTKKSCQVFVYARDSLLLYRSHRELIFVLQDQVK